MLPVPKQCHEQTRNHANAYDEIRNGNVTMTTSLIPRAEVVVEGHKQWPDVGQLDQYCGSKQNLKSTGVHDGMEVERWLGWSPPSFIQIESKLPKFVFGVVSGWVGVG